MRNKMRKTGKESKRKRQKKKTMCGKQQQDHDNVPVEKKHGEGQKPAPSWISTVSPLGE